MRTPRHRRRGCRASVRPVGTGGAASRMAHPFVGQTALAPAPAARRRPSRGMHCRLERLRPWRRQHHAKPEPKRQHIVQSDRRLGGDRFTVDRSERRRERAGRPARATVRRPGSPAAAGTPPRGSAPPPRRSAWSSTRRGRCCAGDGVGSPRVSRPATPTSTWIACGEQPGDTADPVLLDMGHASPGRGPARPLRVEIHSVGFDATTVENSSGAHSERACSTSMTVRIGCLGAAKIANQVLFKPAGTVARRLRSWRSLPATSPERRRWRPSTASRTSTTRTTRCSPTRTSTPSTTRCPTASTPLDAPGTRGRQARPVREAVHRQRRRGGAVAEAARSSGLVVMEAFHWRYHPLAEADAGLIAGGRSARSHDRCGLLLPAPASNDIRWQLDLAGGAFMDAGCYAVHMARTFAGAGEPRSRRTAKAGLRASTPAGGRAAVPEAGRRDVRSMWSHPADPAAITGDDGHHPGAQPARAAVLPPSDGSRPSGQAAGEGRRPSRRTPTSSRRSRPRWRTGAPTPTGLDDAIANVHVIDAAYTAAGLGLRRGSVG